MTSSRPSPSVSGTFAPIARATETNYVVRVKNNGAQPETNVVLTVTLGAGLVAVPLGTEGPGVAMAIENQGATVRFAPIRELRPGEEVAFKVRARGDQPGRIRIQAAVTSAAVAMPVTAEEDTTVNP